MILDRSTAPATILVVDDEQSIRKLTRRILELSGYVVKTACSGIEAPLEICDTPGSFVDLVLTDVQMPNMTGTELARVLARRHPNIQVICMSGYVGSVFIDPQSEHRGIHFLNKPFGAKVLAQKVAEVLALSQAVSPLRSDVCRVR